MKIKFQAVVSVMMYPMYVDPSEYPSGVNTLVTNLLKVNSNCPKDRLVPTIGLCVSFFVYHWLSIHH